MLSLTYYEPQSVTEKVLFANTILQFTYRSSWIKIPQVFPFFVRVIMQNLKETLKKPTKAEKETKKGFMDRHSLRKIQKLSLKAIKNISLTPSVHKEIFQAANLATFLVFIEKIHVL